MGKHSRSYHNYDAHWVRGATVVQYLELKYMLTKHVHSEDAERPAGSSFVMVVDWQARLFWIKIN